MWLKVHKSKTEKELIKGCQKGEGKAQRAVYEKYSPIMLGLCCRYIKDEMEAEDVMIFGFTKVFQKIDQFENKGSFEGWIRRIMVNEALTYIRRNKNMYLETDIEEADHEPDYNEIESSLEAEELMKMINDLPAGYRTVFNLYAIEGYSHKEIAEILEINQNTSKSQLSRARNILQKKLLEREKVIKKTVKQ